MNALTSGGIGSLMFELGYDLIDFTMSEDAYVHGYSGRVVIIRRGQMFDEFIGRRRIVKVPFRSIYQRAEIADILRVI